MDELKKAIKRLYKEIPSYEDAWYALKRVEEEIKRIEQK